MQCNQLIRLIKGWFLHVKDETMAPARMMQFIDQHVKECETCREDPELTEELEKIREFVLPESKIPKAYRSQNKTPTPEISPAVDTSRPAAARTPKPATKT
jgi:hypothetical protein